MITAREKGRNLELIVGGGDDALAFTVRPIPARDGTQLLADWVGVVFGEVDGQDALDTARSLAQRALGPVVDEIEDLRWAEQEQIVNAAFFWNVQGGGIDLVNEYLAGGLPKARETLIRGVGLWDAWVLIADSLSLTSPNSESESLTSTADSPDTSTPAGSESSKD